MNVLGILCI